MQLLAFSWICFTQLVGRLRSFREHGNKGINFKGQRELGLKNEGNRGTKKLLEHREHRKWRFWFWATGEQSNWAWVWTANKMTHAHGEDADQPGNPPRLIRVFVVSSMRSHGSKVSIWGQGRQIRLGGYPGWAESSLGAHVIWSVLSCNSFIYLRRSRGIDSPASGRASCMPQWLASLYGGSCSCHFMRTKLQVLYMVYLAEQNVA